MSRTKSNSISCISAAIVVISILLSIGCSPDQTSELEEDFLQKTDAGTILWADAQQFIPFDPFIAEELLAAARDFFLQAAIIKPGDLSTAEKITAISNQLNKIKKRTETQRNAQGEIQNDLTEAVKRLKELTDREKYLAQIGTRMTRRHPSATKEDKNNAITPSWEEQIQILTGTKDVSEMITGLQSTIREMLSAIYKETNASRPTEYDQAVKLLKSAQLSQTTSVKHLKKTEVNWTQVNGAFHGAKWQMEQALRILSDQARSQTSGNQPEQNGQQGDPSDWSDDMHENTTDTVNAEFFKEALKNRSLPTPNYTSEEILQEEADYMKERAQHQAKRSAQKVEKNW